MDSFTHSVVIRFLLFVGFWRVALAATAACYRPDGTQVDSAYQPCNGTSGVSMCCHLGVGNNDGDKCGSGSTYGLCGITGTQLWRESCTDPTWKSPSCLKLCIDGDYYKNDAEITSCGDGSYCCGTSNSSCCSAKEGIFIVNNQLSTALPETATLTSSSLSLLSSLSPSSSTTTTTTTTTTTATTSAVDTPSSHNPGGGVSSSPRDTLGIGIGISVGGLVLIGGLGLFIWRLRQRKREPNTAASQQQPQEMPAMYHAPRELYSYYAPTELHAPSNPIELASDAEKQAARREPQPPSELPG